LLLFCLGTAKEGSKAVEPARWTDSEWDALIRQSIRHGVSAYLFHRLKAQDPALPLPGPVERRLREMTLRNASRNFRVFHELGKTLKILRDQGLPVILLKGAHLAGGVYDHIALRQMGDVDILVKRGDLHKTVATLFQAGFHVIDEKLDGYVEWSAGNRYHIPPHARHFFTLVHPAWPAALDVHCSLMEDDRPFLIDAAGLWDRARTLRTEEIEALALSPVDSLLYQCLHASFHHLFEYGLRPFCDILETLRRHADEIDWEQAQTRAGQWGVERSTYLTLRLSRDLLGAAVPDAVLTGLRPKDFNEDLAIWARDRILSDPGEARAIPFSLIRFWKTRRFRDLAAALLNAVFLSPEKLAIHYNVSPDSGWIFLYYPVRLKDMVHRWGRMTWSIIRRDRKIAPDAEFEGKSAVLEQWLMSKA
jgi:hypothetical protein